MSHPTEHLKERRIYPPNKGGKRQGHVVVVFSGSAMHNPYTLKENILLRFVFLRINMRYPFVYIHFYANSSKRKQFRKK